MSSFNKKPNKPSVHFVGANSAPGSNGSNGVGISAGKSRPCSARTTPATAKRYYENSDDEEAVLKEEIGRLYQMIKRRYDRINKLKTRRAVREEKRRLRRQTMFQLPKLEEVVKEKEEITNSILELIGSDNDNDKSALDQLNDIIESNHRAQTIILDEICRL